MAGGQALPSTPACAGPEYAKITRTGTTWASPWAGPWPHGLRIPRGTYAEHMRNICGTYAEPMRNICGTYAEHMRNSCGAASMAGGQAPPSTPACAGLEYAKMMRTGTTWASPWANIGHMACGYHAEHMRNICGTYAEHMRNSCGATSMAGRQDTPSTSARAQAEYAKRTRKVATWGDLGLNLGWANVATWPPDTMRNICGTYAELERSC